MNGWTRIELDGSVDISAMDSQAQQHDVEKWTMDWPAGVETYNIIKSKCKQKDALHPYLYFSGELNKGYVG